MEWGDDGLTIEAAAENAFNFKEGSPQDIDYQLRLRLVKTHFQRKRMESVFFGIMIYRMLLCIQRTVAQAEDVYGESAHAALMRFVEFASGYPTQEGNVKQLSLDEQIEIYRERYKQEYAT